MQSIRIFTCPECGHTFSVSESSAGEICSCPGCQKSITLPTLGELRKLPVQEQPLNDIVKDKTVSELDRRMGIMILLGAVALTFVILAAIWGYWYYYYYTNIYAIQYMKWNVIQTWTQWQFLRPGIDAPLTEAEHENLYQLRILWKWLVIYLSFATVCIAGIVLLWIKPIRKESKPLSNKQ